MIKRFYQQQPVVLRPEWQFGIAAVALAILLPLFLFDSNRVGMVFVLAPVCALVAFTGLAVVRTVTYQNFRHSPYFGKTSACLISEDGLLLSDVWGDDLVRWPTIKWIVRYPDGILVLRRLWISRDWVQLQPRRLCWLPDLALEAASPRDVIDLIAGRMALRRVA
jgi:hypothetical protein